MICVGAATLLVGGYSMGIHFWDEYQWRMYQGEIEEGGISLKLPEPHEAIPPEENLAAEAPFAPVRVGADGKPVDPPTLKNDLLPADFLPDISHGKAAFLGGARAPLEKYNLGLPLDSDREIARALLAACDRQMGEQWARILVAEAKPDAQFNIRYWPMPMAQKVPVADFRTAAQTHCLRATALLHLGRGSEAVKEIEGGLRLADALWTDPSLVIYMLHTVIVGLEMNAVWEGLNTGGWSDADLVALEELLCERNVGLGYTRAIDTERGWINAVCNDLALHPSKASADELKEWVAGLSMPVPFPGVRHWQCSIIRDNQLMLNRHYDAVRERIDGRGDWHETVLPLVVDKLSAADKKRYRLAGLAITDFTKVEGRMLAVEARVRQARLAIAVERYRRKTGELPEKLDAVVPEFLAEVPGDPMDDAPMRYARDAARSYRLWSIGDDREDDQGVADAEMCKMTLDTVWPGLVAGKPPRAEKTPPDRGPRALRTITSSYAMAW